MFILQYRQDHRWVDWGYWTSSENEITEKLRKVRQMGVHSFKLRYVER